MNIPIMLGQPLHLWLGVILLILLIFQIAIAKRLVPVPFKWHRVLGYVILGLAVIHGSLAAGLYSGIFTIMY